MESFVLFMRVCPNGSLVNLFLLMCCVSGIGVVGIIGVMVAWKVGEWYVIVDVSVSLLVLCWWFILFKLSCSNFEIPFTVAMGYCILFEVRVVNVELLSVYALIELDMNSVWCCVL